MKNLKNLLGISAITCATRIADNALLSGAAA